MGHLLHIFGVLFDVLVHLLLFCEGEFGRTSTSFMIIQSSKTSCVPGIKPVIECQTFYRKNLHECIRGHALETQQNTMGTLSDTMMLTLFMQSTEYTLGFRA